MDKYNPYYNQYQAISDDDSSNWINIMSPKYGKPKKHYPYISNKNLKKILCLNILHHGICNYGDKCLYAHSLDEQNVGGLRKQVYDILNGSGSLKDIDLHLPRNFGLYKTLMELTKVCFICVNGKCTGGYNCKYGAVSEQYHICIMDLNYGTCQNDCPLVHLTKRGMKPYFEGVQTESVDDDDIASDISSIGGNESLDDYETSIFT